jgi:tripartite-type tricarboxylate transporter receptor subunit TctC
MKTRLSLFTLMACLFGAAQAIAQDYPSAPIRIITGYGPGGIGFTVPRMFGEELGNVLKQRVVIDDRPGAGNSIGARAGVKSKPDGYNLFIGGLGPHPLMQKNGVDVSAEMLPVALVLEVPLVFATSTKLPLKTVAELVSYARANPNKLNFASSGGSAYLALMMRLLAERAGGISYVHVPYKSATEIQVGFSTGDVHIALVSALSTQASTKRGESTPILLAGRERSPMLPNVPTPAEAGIKDFSVETLFGLWAPVGTPREIISKLNAAANEVAGNPAYIARVSGGIGVTPQVATPEQTLARFRTQLRLIQEAVRLSNYTPE